MRSKYLDQVQKNRINHPLILLSGLHGSGKSYFLSSVIKVLRNEKPTVKIVQIGRDSAVADGRDLLGEARALGAGPSALCIDDAENINDLVPALSEIIRKYSVTVFITGQKTAKLEATLRNGFPVELAVIRIHPFSYGEFLDAHGMEDSRNAVDLYARCGGLPESLKFAHDPENMRAFLTMRANAFILTEIIEEHSIRNPGHIREILSLAARSGGKALSARMVCAVFSAHRITISPQAALNYLEFCGESGILVSIPVLDIKAKKNLDAGRVWYFGDTGLRSAFAAKENQENQEDVFENLLLLHLKDEGWAVSQGRIEEGKGNQEKISFVCDRDCKRMYVQLIANAAPPKDRLRKREALLSVRDAWPKYLVDAEAGTGEADGIRTVFLRDLLLGRDV
jgi:predicted AAA+ superfamily ATPase